jgi:hypothetical protein
MIKLIEFDGFELFNKEEFSYLIYEFTMEWGHTVILGLKSGKKLKRYFSCEEYAKNKYNELLSKIKEE